MTLNVDEHLLLCDLETTGLDPRDDLILEVGFVVTTLDFRVVSSFTELVAPGHQIAWDELSEIVQQMHNTNGLREAIDAGKGEDLDTVEADLTDWYFELFGKGKCPLVGSSVSFDRGFLREHFVDFPDMIHYRNIDFSSVKELCRRYNPEVYSKLPVAQAKHRAIPDLEDTINEARFYVDNFLHTTRPAL
jgi:oligoribonuclease